MTVKDFGGDPMSVALKEYFDKQFEGLEKRFDSLIEDIKELPCVDHNGRILQIQQQLENGIVAEDNVHRNKAERLTIWRIFISIVGLAIVAMQVWDKIRPG